MRKKFEVQYELGAVPIEKIKLPVRSRDEIPPVLRALQYIYSTPEISEQVFSLLEKKVMTNIQRTGRPGMNLWEILVFATVRLALDANYDRLELIANYDSLIRSFLGISNFADNLKQYSLQSLKDNVRLLDEQTLDEINQLVVKAGHSLKKNEKLDVKIDSYVLETNVHFPTDLNLLWDACRKSIALTSQLLSGVQLSGWRKYRQWRKHIKSAYQRAAKQSMGAGKQRRTGLNAVIEYLSIANELHEKLQQSQELLAKAAKKSASNLNKYNKLVYFQQQVVKHIDLVRRRLIQGEQIKHDDKIFSLFEPYTEWLKRGKIRAEVELGLKIAIATDQQGFILGHRIMQQEQDVDIAVPLSKQLLSWSKINSLSFDKGFWSPQNFSQLSSLVEHVIMPKKGRRNQAEYQREHHPDFMRLRRNHAAVESAINSLEYHGLDRCPDKGLTSFRRYVSLGVLAYNLHKLGNILLAQDREQLSKNNGYAKAA